ncbi:MAG: AAA family ATPase [Gammaproteobacteria bacterium]|nr:AAA family ATPase [Gammaproteobacteria bacterium]
MNVIIAVSSKGSVTKTTLISNLAGLLADSGYRVLAIDAENTQPALSSHYPIVEQATNGFIKLIKERCLGPEVISKTSIDGLDIVVSDDRSDTLSEYILHEADGRYRISQALKTAEDH